MSDKIIDMRVKARGCTEHPLVQLHEKMKAMKKGDRIKIITDNKSIPIGVIEIVASKYGAKVKIIKEEQGIVEAEIFK
ncbi:MAG: hypothetical protein J7L82_01400 [Staphylothermus sp.]|nr:hypothetical protein [Staphylothermus sp.]